MPPPGCRRAYAAGWGTVSPRVAHEFLNAWTMRFAAGSGAQPVHGQRPVHEHLPEPQWVSRTRWGVRRAYPARRTCPCHVVRSRARHARCSRAAACTRSLARAAMGTAIGVAHGPRPAGRIARDQAIRCDQPYPRPAKRAPLAQAPLILADVPARTPVLSLSRRRADRGCRRRGGRRHPDARRRGGCRPDDRRGRPGRASARRRAGRPVAPSAGRRRRG